ncbi:LAGLIDADG family homing endonuclease, partial [Salmonella enterica]|uniref:LAGLIDADG family homing endonuclease n=1 Tax=Salmonella enterica TaxID=28901 RepID=UPI003EDBCF1F
MAGFIQSDGCFTITFEKKKTGLLIKPKPIFVLTQSSIEEEMFKELCKYLGFGYTVKKKDLV